MKIAVTGSSKLAGAFVRRFGCDPIRVNHTSLDKSHYDVLINNAHVGFEQTYILESWFAEWRYQDKLIINISSRAGLSNLSKGYMYAAQKAALDHMADNLVYNSDKICRITTIGLGLLEDDLPSVSYYEVCDLVEYILSMPKHLEIPRVYLQHAQNYQSVQQRKAYRYGHNEE